MQSILFVLFFVFPSLSFAGKKSCSEILKYQKRLGKLEAAYQKNYTSLDGALQRVQIILDEKPIDFDELVPAANSLANGSDVERLKLLFARPFHPKELAKYNSLVEEIEGKRANAPTWKQIVESIERGDCSPDIQKGYDRLMALRRPRVDRFNIHSAKEVEAWRKANELVTRWAMNETNLNRENYSELNKILLQASNDERPGHFLGADDINYVVRKGQRQVRAQDIFLMGKFMPFEFKLKPLMNFQGEMDPLWRAYLVRLLFNTIHPFFNGVGRESRLLTDYILIRSGYFPAVIESSHTSKKDSFVALLPYAPFDEQVSPSAGAIAMLEGILKAYETLGY